MTKAANKGLEEEVQILKKHFGPIIATVEDLTCSVEDLKKKLSLKENDEIREIIETQRVIDEVIVANSDAINRIDKEIKDIINSRF